MQLIDHLDSSDLLSKTQFSYRKNRSTELATVLLSDNNQNAVDKGHILAELYVRSNKLSHSALLDKLKSFEITSDSHNWFTGYLFNRK